jgi:sodium-coupled neutral amino acid transporter 2
MYAVHTIENELEDYSPWMQGVVWISLALCTTVYVMTGLFGFLLFGDSTLSDLLSNFDTDVSVLFPIQFPLQRRCSYKLHRTYHTSISLYMLSI